MAKGEIRKVSNIDKKFGAKDSYLFLKVQADYSHIAEEYFLLTEEEFREASARGFNNPEDSQGLDLGILTMRNNTLRKFGASPYYYAVRCEMEEGGREINLLFTESEIDRIRSRVDSNPEDIESNRENWLMDMFD